MVCPVIGIFPGVKMGSTVTCHVPEEAVRVVLQVPSLARRRYQVVTVNPDGGSYDKAVAPEISVAVVNPELVLLSH